MPQAAGLSAADLTARAQIGTLKRNNNGQSGSDKVREALALRHDVLADQIVEKTVNEMGVDALKAQNERLKLEIEARQLQEAARPGIAPDTSWRDYLLKQMDSLDGRLTDANRQLTEQQLRVFQERVQMLEGELQRLGSRPEPPDDLTVLKAKLQTAKELMELVAPPIATPPPPTGNGDEAMWRAWMRRVDSEDERWKLEREDRHQERLAELQLRQEIAQGEVQAKREYYAMLGRGVEQTLPKILKIVELFSQKWLASSELATGTPAAGDVAPAAGGPAAIAQPNLPTGAHVAACQTCGARMIYREDYPVVICSNCGESYNLNETPDGGGNAGEGTSGALG